MKVIKTIPQVVTKAKTVYKLSQDEIDAAIKYYVIRERCYSIGVLDVTFEVHHDGYVITTDDLTAIVTVEEE
jgi:hypothetical protein